MATSVLLSSWILPKPSREGPESVLFKLWAAEALKPAQPLPVTAAVVAQSNVLDDRTIAIIESRAWETATTPVKSMGMNLFMLYMMGSGAGIFTILLVAYAIIQAVDLISKTSSAFDQFHGANSLILQKIVYFSLSVAILAYLGNKAGHMGLVPWASGDWISLFPVTTVTERIVFP